MSTERFDVVVIGAGPGGEVAAIRASLFGLKVALVEKNEHLGGTCLNVGCIPTKALLESAKTWAKLGHLAELGFSADNISYSWDKIMSRKESIVDAQRKGLKFLMKKNKIAVFHGVGSFKEASPRSQTIEVELAGKKQQIETTHTIIATGSRVRELPFAPANGVDIHTSDTVLFVKEIPHSLAVIGGGVVGMEFASLFARFGTEVHVLEASPTVLPFEDEETVAELSRYFTRKLGIKISAGQKLLGIEKDRKANLMKLHIEGGEDLSVQKVLVSIGRAPVTEGLGLERIGIHLEKGFIPVDAHYRTTVPNVFAIGDVINTPALAHTASAEGIHVAELIGGHHPAVIDYETNPSAIYTYPEIASIGKTEAALKKAGVPYKATKFPFAPLAKAKIEDATEGFIKLLLSEPHRELLGVHIVGAKATELIAEFALGKLLETTIDEIGQTIHPHPTISETIMEAAHAAMHGPIHL